MKKFSTFNSRLFLSIVVLSLAIGSLSGCFVKVAPSGGGDPITPPAESKGLTGYTQANINDWQPIVTIMVNRETSSSQTPTVLSIPWSMFFAYSPFLSFPDYPLISSNYYHMGVTFPSTYQSIKDPILMVFKSRGSVLEDAWGTFPDPDINRNPANLQPIFEEHGRGIIDIYIAFTDKYTDEKFYLTLFSTGLQ